MNFVIILLLFNCDSQKQTLHQKTKQVFPDQEGWNSTLIITKEGRKSVRIEYGHMEKFDRKKNVYFGQHVKVDMFDKNGNMTTQLFADSAILKEATNDMEAIGNIKVIRGDTTYYPSTLKWFDSARRIECRGSFQMITQQGDTLNGKDFVWDLKTGAKYFKQAAGVASEKIDITGMSTKRSKPDQPADTLQTLSQDSLTDAKNDTSLSP